MRLITTIVAIAVLTGIAAAASQAKQCRHVCGGLIAACAKDTRAAGFGDLTRGCTQSVLKRCKHEGAAACGVFCGNSTVDPGEECDGTNLGGATCESLGFAKGALACAPGCTFDTRGCGPSTVPACGNGVREGAEQCDGRDLGGATCTSLGFNNGGALGCTSGCGFDVSGCRLLGFPATGQTTCWDSGGTVVPCGGSGQDGDTRTGAPLAYVDNGDGTITDANTGLMWEKQSNGDGSVHDIANLYTWVQAFSLHVAALNTAPCFAGHCDWRVPNWKELVSIMNIQTLPAVSPAFDNHCTAPCTVLTCSCTPSNHPHWSSSSYLPAPTFAYSVSFEAGSMEEDPKTSSDSVRAVRGGS